MTRRANTVDNLGGGANTKVKICGAGAGGDRF